MTYTTQNGCPLSKKINAGAKQGKQKLCMWLVAIKICLDTIQMCIKIAEKNENITTTSNTLFGYMYQGY